jgi:hypothetical protein
MTAEKLRRLGILPGGRATHYDSLGEQGVDACKDETETDK